MCKPRALGAVGVLGVGCVCVLLLWSTQCMHLWVGYLAVLAWLRGALPAGALLLGYA